MEKKLNSMSFEDLRAVVSRTRPTEYGVKNVYGVNFLLLINDVNHILREAKRLTPAKANCYYHNHPAGERELLATTDSQAQYMHGMAGLLSELEEIDEAVQTKGRHEIAVEIGDALWFLEEIAASQGLTLGVCAAAMDAKLRRRYPEKFSNEAALHRNLLAEQMAYEEAVEEMGGKKD